MTARFRSSKPLRVVQWTTGNVAQQTVRAVLERPDLELVGVFAHSDAKVGCDVAELCGLPEPIGITATNDIGTLFALAPDCVIYNALHFDADEVARILGAGINIVTSSEFLTGGALTNGQRQAIEAAAASGEASIFGSGMNPGFGQLLAGVAAGASLGVRHVRMTESVDVSLYAADANMNALGWGRGANDPDHPAAIEAATLVFRDGVQALAAILGFEPDECRCTADFALATEDLDLPGRPIAAGTVAGIDVRWEGLLDGVSRVELHQRWVMSRRIDPAWAVEHGWIMEVAGNPNIRLKMDVWPDTDDLASLTPVDLHNIGMRLTGLPVVNAIPAVCAAAPGIRTYADLPTVSTRLFPSSPGDRS